MTVHAIPVDFVDTNMTSKGQVLIPKTLRDQAGLTPTRTVQVGLNEEGEVVIRPKRQEETADERMARVMAAIDKVRGTIDTGFATTDEYMDFIRPWRHDP